MVALWYSVGELLMFEVIDPFSDFLCFGFLRLHITITIKIVISRDMQDKLQGK